MKYNWQQHDWPIFTYDLAALSIPLQEYAHWSGILRGTIRGISTTDYREILIDLIVQEAQKTSAIEGEVIDENELYSSIRNHLGMNPTLEPVNDQRAKSIVDVIFDMRESYREKLTTAMLFKWHKLLFNYPIPLSKVQIGKWRTHEETMQVVSGRPGKLKIHFEAPPSANVPLLMNQFIDWYNLSSVGSAKEISSEVIRAGIAHLYFESIHPFDDGNGRIGRVIAEKALAQGLKQPVLFSLSYTIEKNRKLYYEALKEGQASNEITRWLKYFILAVTQAQKETDKKVSFAILKAKFLAKCEHELNTRQLKVVRRMLREGPNGFVGGITAKKYMTICKTSKATATRDLQNLVDSNILIAIGSGRSTHYDLNFRRLKV